MSQQQQSMTSSARDLHVNSVWGNPSSMERTTVASGGDHKGIAWVVDYTREWRWDKLFALMRSLLNCYLLWPKRSYLQCMYGLWVGWEIANFVGWPVVVLTCAHHKNQYLFLPFNEKPIIDKHPWCVSVGVWYNVLILCFLYCVNFFANTEFNAIRLFPSVDVRLLTAIHSISPKDSKNERTNS